MWRTRLGGLSASSHVIVGAAARLECAHGYRDSKPVRQRHPRPGRECSVAPTSPWAARRGLADLLAAFAGLAKVTPVLRVAVAVPLRMAPSGGHRFMRVTETRAEDAQGALATSRSIGARTKSAQEGVDT